MKKLIFPVVMVAVFGVWLTSWILLARYIPDASERGHFGDQFGAVNALFSGLAFAVIFCALYAQHEELREQRRQFQKQVELAALASYANLTVALWEHNEKQRESQTGKDFGSQEQSWAKAAKDRYDEMMKARKAFEDLLKETHVLDKS